MSQILIRSDRIKTLDISDGKNVLCQARFNPFDMGIYKLYTEIRMQLAKDKQAYDQLVKEYRQTPGINDDEDTERETDYEALNRQYQAEMKLSGGIDNIFDNLKKGIDGIFGGGVYDAVTMGYKDEGMLTPLLEAAAPFFDEAGRERNEQVEKAMLSREQRRAKRG